MTKGLTVIKAKDAMPPSVQKLIDKAIKIPPEIVKVAKTYAEVKVTDG